ncbi:hypothetical protein EASAB2608_06524 [Streptomyces sp. EAS-AB2608]|nr:hypothetical protein EASAB2608_06524 [Streptomyces sp. EAS-AB2608]
MWLDCSPHPRGWSLRAGHDWDLVDLLPAPAGMVPIGASGPALPLTAPRTRGDGPGEASPWDIGDACSPHPRGWSQRGLDRRVQVALLPAPAGMVPGLGHPPIKAGTAPRTRGDGPYKVTSKMSVTVCSPHPRGWSLVGQFASRLAVLLPAPAGMVPAARPAARTRTPAPRTRGDGPAPASTSRA